VLTSSSENKGIDDLWTKLIEFKQTMLENNEFYSKRQSQLKLWFWTHLKENLLESLLAMPEMKRKLEFLENEVINGINCVYISTCIKCT
jgi:LAO/AO transport system kinase